MLAGQVMSATRWIWIWVLGTLKAAAKSCFGRSVTKSGSDWALRGRERPKDYGAKLVAARVRRATLRRRAVMSRGLFRCLCCIRFPKKATLSGRV